MYTLTDLTAKQHTVLTTMKSKLNNLKKREKCVKVRIRGEGQGKGRRRGERTGEKASIRIGRKVNIKQPFFL